MRTLFHESTETRIQGKAMKKAQEHMVWAFLQENIIIGP